MASLIFLSADPHLCVNHENVFQQWCQISPLPFIDWTPPFITLQNQQFFKHSKSKHENIVGRFFDKAMKTPPPSKSTQSIHLLDIYVQPLKWVTGNPNSNVTEMLDYFLTQSGVAMTSLGLPRMWSCVGNSCLVCVQPESLFSNTIGDLAYYEGVSNSSTLNTSSCYSYSENIWTHLER